MAGVLRKADFWLRLPGKPPGGRVFVSAHTLAASLGLRPDQLASLRVFEMTIVGYFCEQFPVFVQVDGDLGASLNTVARSDTDRVYWAVLFGVSRKPHAHAVELDRASRMQSFDFTDGITFRVSSTRGALMPHDAGFQLRLGVVPVDRPRRDPSPPGIQKPLQSPVMQRVKSTPEHLHSDIDESPSFPRFRNGAAPRHDGNRSENDLPTPYETSAGESDATVIVHASTETESSSSSSEEQSPGKQTVPDTPPPHGRRSGPDDLRSSRARDQPSPTSSATNLYAFI